MRRILGMGLAVSCLTALSGAAPAQQRGYFNRVTTQRRATTVTPTANRDQGRPDPFSPYVPSSRGFSGGGTYQRARVEPPPRYEPRAVTVERTHNYFPGLRSAQGTNRNYIPPHTLCTPGRRAFMYR